MDNILKRYGSVRELVAHVAAKSDKKGSSHTRCSGYADDFYGGLTFDQAVQTAIDGWDGPRPAIEAMLAPIREKLADKLDNVTVRMHDMFGYEPDIDRFVAGELECMWEDVMIEEPSQGRVFTMLVSTSVLGSVDSDIVFKRGAAIVALVEAFQILGCDLTIYVENSCRSTECNYGKANDGVYTVLTQIHKAGDHLDINNVMFPLGHPAWQRRLVFGEREANTAKVRSDWGFTVRDGMGSTTEAQCDELVDASIVIAQEPSRYDQMITDPVAWVLNILEAQGVYHPDEIGGV